MYQQKEAVAAAGEVATALRGRFRALAVRQAELTAADGRQPQELLYRGRLPSTPMGAASVTGAPCDARHAAAKYNNRGAIKRITADTD